MKVLHTTSTDTIKKVYSKSRDNNPSLIGIRTDKMIDNGESMKKFPVFNIVPHSFIELSHEAETLSIRTKNGKMITIYLTENGEWANIDLKLHNEGYNTKVIAFDEKNSESIKGNIYAMEINKNS